MKKSALIFFILSLAFFCAALFLFFSFNKNEAGKQSSELYALAGEALLNTRVNSACIADDGVLLAKAKGGAAKLSFDGKILWDIDLKGGMLTSKISESAGCVLVSNAEGSVFALSSKDGEILWTFKAGDKITGRFLFKDGSVIFASYDKKVYVLNLANGAEIFSFESEDAINGSVALFENLIYFGDCAGKISCVDLSDKKLLWQADFGSYVPSTPCIANGSLLVLGHSGAIVSYDLKSGKILWENENAKASPLIDLLADADNFYFVDESGFLNLAETANGNSSKKIDLGGTRLDIFMSENIFIIYADGFLKVLEKKNLQDIYKARSLVSSETFAVKNGYFVWVDSNSKIQIFAKNDDDKNRESK